MNNALIPTHLSRLLLEVDLPAVRMEAVAEGVERQDQVETRTDKCLKGKCTIDLGTEFLS